MPYSAVIHPLPRLAIHSGTFASIEQVQRTVVRPILTVRARERCGCTCA